MRSGERNESEKKRHGGDEEELELDDDEEELELEDEEGVVIIGGDVIKVDVDV